MASTYGTVRYKDTGDSVAALQNALNSAGYNLTVDGVFGDNTLSAVKDYQQANGLTVDGIVGDNTWGALNGRSGSSTGVWDQAVGGDDLSAALQQLMTQYNSTPGYVKKTDEQIRAQAEGEYGTYYDQMRLAAQQQQERSDLALQQQQENLQTTYDKQRKAAREEYENAYSQADRQMLSRGMQRSSYTAQVLANLSQKGAEAQEAIWDQQAAAEGQIGAQRTQLAQQLAQQLMQYDASQASDVMNRIREIEDQEYQRGVTDQNTRNALSTQIYEFMQQAQQQKIAQEQWQAQMDYQKERDTISDQQWQKQFDESVRQFNETQKKKSGSGGGSSKKAAAATTDNTQGTGATTGMTYNDFMNALNGNSSGVSTVGSSVLSGLSAGALTSAGISTLVKTEDASKKNQGTISMTEKKIR